MEVMFAELCCCEEKATNFLPGKPSNSFLFLFACFNFCMENDDGASSKRLLSLTIKSKECSGTLINRFNPFVVEIQDRFYFVCIGSFVILEKVKFEAMRRLSPPLIHFPRDDDEEEEEENICVRQIMCAFLPIIWPHAIDCCCCGGKGRAFFR